MTNKLDGIQTCIVATSAVDDTVDSTVVVTVVIGRVRKLKGKKEFGNKLGTKNFLSGLLPRKLNGARAWVSGKDESITPSPNTLGLKYYLCLYYMNSTSLFC